MIRPLRQLHRAAWPLLSAALVALLWYAATMAFSAERHRDIGADVSPPASADDAQAREAHR